MVVLTGVGLLMRRRGPDGLKAAKDGYCVVKQPLRIYVAYIFGIREGMR
jgi:hypothetical protein